jgi:hypothetical protein
LNFDLSYRMPLPRSAWSMALGAGPALNLYRRSGDTDSAGGFNILVGFLHQAGLGFQFKVGALDSPSIKVGVGYTFRR